MSKKKRRKRSLGDLPVDPLFSPGVYYPPGVTPEMMPGMYPAMPGMYPAMPGMYPAMPPEMAPAMAPAMPPQNLNPVPPPYIPGSIPSQDQIFPPYQSGPVMPGYPGIPVMPGVPGAPGPGYGIPLAPPRPVLPQEPPPLHDRIYDFLFEALTDSAVNDEDILRFLLSKKDDSELRDQLNRYDRAQKAFKEIVTERYQPQILPFLDKQAPLRILRNQLNEEKTKAIREQNFEAQALIQAKIEGNEANIADIAAAINSIVEKQKAEMAPYQADLSMDFKSMIIEFIDRNVGELLTIVQDALSEYAEMSEARIAEIQAEHETELKKDQEAFNAFYDEKIKKILKPYEESIKAAQDNAAYHQKRIEQKQGELQAMAEAVGVNLQMMGNLIGWLAHSHGWSEPSAEQINLLLEEIIRKYSGRTQIDADLGPIASLLAGSMTLYQGEDLGELATRTLNQMNQIQVQAAILKNTWVPESQKQIEESRKALDWTTEKYNYHANSFKEEWFAQSVIREYKEAKQKRLIQELMDTGKINDNMPQSLINRAVDEYLNSSDVKRQIGAINNKTLAMNNKFKAISNAIEEHILEKDEMKMPDLTKMKYEEKRDLYFGACHYVHENKDKIKELVDRLKKLAETVNDNSSEEDKTSVVVGQKVISLFTFSTNIKRKLEEDMSFMQALGEDQIYGYLLPKMKTGEAS